MDSKPKAAQPAPVPAPMASVAGGTGEDIGRVMYELNGIAWGHTLAWDSLSQDERDRQRQAAKIFCARFVQQPAPAVPANDGVQPWAYIAADHIESWISLAGRDILSEGHESRRNRIYSIITKFALLSVAPKPEQAGGVS